MTHYKTGEYGPREVSLFRQFLHKIFELRRWVVEEDNGKCHHNLTYGQALWVKSNCGVESRILHVSEMSKPWDDDNDDTPADGGNITAIRKAAADAAGGTGPGLPQRFARILTGDMT